MNDLDRRRLANSIRTVIGELDRKAKALCYRSSPEYKDVRAFLVSYEKQLRLPPLSEEWLKKALDEYDAAKMAQLEQAMDGPSEEVLQELLRPAQLTPSAAGRECLGNGTWPGYECQCPGCDYYETCFPDWEGHKQSV